MHQRAASLIAKITGCTAEQAEAAIASLITEGWRSPELKLPADSQTSTSALPAVDPASVLVAHTDGACSGNPGPGGWSVVFSQDGAVLGEHSGRIGDATSNRMELTAIREALSAAPVGIALEIRTDSNNAVGWLQKGWKRNDPTIAALCREIDGLATKRGGTVTYRHVGGHQGDPLNERADKLAVAAIRERG